MLKLRSVDLTVTAILLAIGIAQFVGGFTMDRLEVRRIHPASIPGLLPMILGIAITIVAGLQLWGLMRSKGNDDGAHVSGLIDRAELLKLLGLIAICAAYALVLVGRIHFWAASSLFVASFVIIFEFSSGMSRRALFLMVARAVIIAVVFGGALSYLFEDLFLVRLP
ncbi:tripartite tricarboxylate transporter TctB family protein [Martelella radicis]|uniref:Putative tricarboxylic transport membrane protein n=1 Tax=Martelella radicis TaxID=1397476 RepID=A0A7W6KGQ1_9HYPH|nr:tripartite tricarboxylate transporter TctB family protein [Martelella radicis]MBB4120936.1 putative tricarboxylic transport membrane protein [Martelella radicis]